MADQQAPGILLALGLQVCAHHTQHFYMSCEDPSQASRKMELGSEVEEAMNKDRGGRLGVSERY